jgi:hypothetical protein
VSKLSTPCGVKGPWKLGETSRFANFVTTADPPPRTELFWITYPFVFWNCPVDVENMFAPM